LSSDFLQGGAGVTRRRPASVPARLGDVLRTVLARLPTGTGLEDWAVWSEWDAAVGPTLARHARPRRLARGVLLVAVDSSEWMQELQFLKHELRSRLNARLGREAIRRIFVVLAADD
jgi:predicted nucleic acid-binding Zn ribbon protein